MTDQILENAFKKYPSFQKARVVRDKRTGKTKGYGFVSFKDVNDYMAAMKEMNGEFRIGHIPGFLVLSDSCLTFRPPFFFQASTLATDR